MRPGRIVRLRDVLIGQIGCGGRAGGEAGTVSTEVAMSRLIPADISQRGRSEIPFQIGVGLPVGNWIAPPSQHVGHPGGWIGIGYEKDLSRSDAVGLVVDEPQQE